MNTKIKLAKGQKALIIGDIHGCYEEMLDLIKLSKIDLSNDYVVSLGDVVDRGPEANLVVEYFLNNKNAILILGNHEMKHLKTKKFDIRNIDLNIQKMLFSDAQYKKALSFFKKAMLFLPIYTENKRYLIVHAEMPDNFEIANQFVDDFNNLTLQQKILTGVGSFSRNGFTKGKPPTWFVGKKYSFRVIFGHIVIDEVIIDNDSNVMGLDTGCVMGGELTGVLLPGEKIIKVKSKQNYDKNVRGKYIDTYYFKNFSHLDWKIKKQILSSDYSDFNKCKPLVSEEYLELSKLSDKINDTVLLITNKLGELTNKQKKKLGLNWNIVFNKTQLLSNELKKAFFSNYNENNLFKYKKNEIKQIDFSINSIISNLNIYIDKLKNIL